MSADEPRDEPPGPDDGLEPLPPLAQHLRERPDRPRPGRAHARSQSRLLLLLMFGAIPLIVVFVVVLNSLSTGPPDRNSRGADEGLNEVARYCVYSVRSTDDYAGCLSATDRRVVAAERTNAGRYARGELVRCLSDAGPMCKIR